MASPAGEQAVADAIQYGRALFKFISPNDAGLTGSHQCGFYLPKSVWKLYSPNPPIRGENKDSFADVLWQDGRITNSRVIWYGSLNGQTCSKLYARWPWDASGTNETLSGYLSHESRIDCPKDSWRLQR